MGEGGTVKRLVGLFIFHPFVFLLIVIFDIYFLFLSFYKEEKKQVYLWLSREGKCLAY